MVWKETWGVHSKLTCDICLDEDYQHLQHIIIINNSILLFTIFTIMPILCLFFSWKEVIFSLKNGKKGLPTQGVVPHLSSGII